MRTITITILLACIICAYSLTTETSFKLWMMRHNVDYLHQAEMLHRLGVYRSNVNFIEEHNKLNLGYTLAINQFADLTTDEFASMYIGLSMPANRTMSRVVYSAHPLMDIPDEIDWRKKGVVTDVKNQGQCGSCWAFSTTGSIESAWGIKYGNSKLTPLSEQSLVDCSRSYGNLGCEGGLMTNAFRYIINSQGINTEASYPYTAQEGGKCRFSTNSIGATISSFAEVLSGSEKALTSAIANVGPISVAIDASKLTFQFYSSGIYHDQTCSPTELNHAVLAVGYGSQDGQDYYIIKNSWGTQWGSTGYILMARNKDNNCGVATMASYPIV